MDSDEERYAEEMDYNPFEYTRGEQVALTMQRYPGRAGIWNFNIGQMMERAVLDVIIPIENMTGQTGGLTVQGVGPWMQHRSGISDESSIYGRFDFIQQLGQVIDYLAKFVPFGSDVIETTREAAEEMRIATTRHLVRRIVYDQ